MARVSGSSDNCPFNAFSSLAKAKRCPSLIKIERLFTGPVAGQEKLLPIPVVDSEGKHAIEISEAVGAQLSISL